ncbi:hypothetical protein SELMODRAFT_21596, partial [Selaginella moellendorffii]
IAEFEDACKNAASIQEELLLGILRKNACCEYLQKYGSPLTVAAFKSQVPVIGYDDIRSDLERIADGDRGQILCHDPITSFFTSSGTSSGKNKNIPATYENTVSVVKVLESSYAYKTNYFDLGKGRSVSLLYFKDLHATKSGLVFGPVTAHGIRSTRFRQVWRSSRTTPYEVLVAASDFRELTYCHLLCALLQRHEVEQVECMYAYSICEALRLFQNEYWEELCNDIRTASLSKTKVTDPKLRKAFERAGVFRSKCGNAMEADKIFKICSNESWSGILPLLFPKAKLVSAVVTGAMTHYVPTLSFYAGDQLPIVGQGFFSSEGGIGINIDPLSPPEGVIYTVTPRSLYYEFLPLGATEALSMHEVVIGELYEILVTNFAGLYRCRMGDVVQITSFFHGAPQMAYHHRKNAVMCINNETVDEQMLQNVVNKVSKDAGVEVLDFMIYGDPVAVPPSYTIFWELGNAKDYSKTQVLEQCCANVLKSFNPEHTRKGTDGLIDSFELVIVKKGTFERLMEEAVKNGASPAQYKTPRCVASSRILEALNSGRVHSYKSSA